jgi:hypothetical protein
MLPHSVSPLTRYSGPAIQMDYQDHRNATSTGSRPAAQAHRNRQQNLVNQGRFGDAIQMEIDDIQSRYGDKYDEAILEMIDHLPAGW